MEVKWPKPGSLTQAEAVPLKQAAEVSHCCQKDLTDSQCAPWRPDVIASEQQGTQLAAE